MISEKLIKPQTASNKEQVQRIVDKGQWKLSWKIKWIENS